MSLPQNAGRFPFCGYLGGNGCPMTKIPPRKTSQLHEQTGWMMGSKMCYMPMFIQIWQDNLIKIDEQAGSTDWARWEENMLSLAKGEQHQR